MAPPHHIPVKSVLALNPGVFAEIKCVLLDSGVGVIRLDTVYVLGREQTKNAVVTKLEGMLKETQSKISSSVSGNSEESAL